MSKIGDFTTDSHNANKGTQRGLRALDTSLRQYGAGRSILVDKMGRVIAGNKTLERAADIGMDDVIVVESDGTKLVAVKRTDLDLDSEDGKARALATYDNRAGQLDLDWDIDALSAVDTDVLKDLWSVDELDELGIIEKPEGDAEPQIDRAAELQEKWQVKTGDLWKIGEHRLLCGDSTKRDDVEKVMGGEKAVVIFTDPPYRMETEGGGALHEQYKRTAERIKDIVDFIPGEFLATLPSYFESGYNSTFIFCNKSLILDYLIYAKENHFSANILVWKKPVVVPFGDSHRPDIEYLVFYRKKAKWINGLKDANYSRCLEYPNQRSEEHPTIKPLELVDNQLRLTSEHGDVIADPFIGSGTTMVACQNLGRKCRAIEISPEYCAVNLERMATAFPGIEIERLPDKQAVTGDGS